MKALTIAFLLAAAAGYAKAEAYCSGTIASNTLINATRAGGTQTGEGCAVAERVTLTLCGCGLPTGEGLPAKASFDHGRVGVGGAIIVQGPSYEVAADTVPYMVSVTYNTFATDAALRVAGSLPPNSVVTISDNTMNVTTPNPALGYDDRIVALLLGDENPMYICMKAQLCILRNIVCAINPCALLTLAAFAIACFTQMLLQIAACCRCCENNCTAIVPPPCKTTTPATTNPQLTTSNTVTSEPPVETTSTTTTTTPAPTTTSTTPAPTTTTTTTPAPTTTTTTTTPAPTTTSTTTPAPTTTTTTTPAPTTTTTTTQATTSTTTPAPTTTTTTTTPAPTTTTTTTQTTTSTTTTTTTTTTTPKPSEPHPPCCNCACGLELSIVVTLSFSAVFAVESNQFDIVQGLAFVAPLIAAVAAAAVSFCFNKCVITRGDGVACRFNEIDACNGTVVTCNENSFESNDCPCIMECARPITLQGSAKFEICLNTFVSVGGSPQVKFGGAISLVQQAQLLINSNSMRRADAEACDLAFFYFEQFIALSAGAELSLSANDCYDMLGSGNVLLCVLAVGKAIQPCSTCPINFCLNKYYDELLQTEAALGGAITDTLVAAVSPMSRCAEAGYSTLAPSNGAGSRDVAVAMLAVAAAASLLL